MLQLGIPKSTIYLQTKTITYGEFGADPALRDMIRQQMDSLGAQVVTIYDCLQADRFEIYKSDGQVSIRHRLFSKTPEILVIQLKRHGYSRRGHSYKVDTRVEYPFELDISQFTTNSSAPNEYELISVVNHVGEDLQSGHYVCFASILYILYTFLF